MANYSELLDQINDAIYENNDQEIDALEVRAILREMVTSLGSGFLFKGIATPSSPSGTGTYEPDQNVFYLATTAGTYTYLGGLVVAAGEVAFLCYDGTWTKKSSALLSTGSIVDNTTTEDATKPLSAKQGKVLADAGAATAEEVTALGQKVSNINDALIYSLGERSDGYNVKWGYAIDGQQPGDIFPSASYSCILDYFPISDYVSVTAKVGGSSVVAGGRFYDANFAFQGYTQQADSAYFRLNINSVTPDVVEVFSSGVQIFPLGYNKAATQTQVDYIENRLEEVEGLVNGQAEPQKVISAYVSGDSIVANSAWTTVIAKVKPNQTATLVSLSTSTIRYRLYSSEPIIGDNSAIGVGTMVTGSTTAAIPNVLPFYYVAFSIQADKIDEPGIHIDADMYLSPDIDQRVSSLEVSVAGMEDKFDDYLPKPFYGNLLFEKCPNFYKAMKNKDKDVVVCLSGTSLTQGNMYASLKADRLERPPLMQANDLASAVFDELSKLWPGQKYRRFDHPSVTRSSSTWADSGVNAIWDDSGNIKNGYTGRTKDANAYIRYVVPADAWRFNFIYRTDTEGDTCSVAISEGNNKMEVWNGSAWVEANGYTFSMLESAPTATKGNTCFQKRLNMRCKNKASGGINSIGATKTLTISKGNNSTDSFNVVGFEWSPREFMLQVINGARGGHCWGYQTEILVPEENNLEKYQDLDLWAFNPDLVLCEVTAINWAAGSQRAIAYDPNWFVNLAKRHYFNEFNDCAISLYAKTNGYTDTEVIFYGDTLSISGTNADVWDASGNPAFGVVTTAATNGDTDTSNVGRVKTAIENYDAIDAYMLSKDELFIPVTEKFIEFAEKYYGSYLDALAASGASGDTLSYDGTHLNDRGVVLWSAFILPLFNF